MPSAPNFAHNPSIHPWCSAGMGNGPGSGNQGPIQLTMSFSNSQILNLRTTPVPVIAAPSAGSVIQLLNGWWEFVPGSVPYTITSSGDTSDPVLYYGGGAFNPPFTLDAGLTANDVIVSGNTQNLWFTTASVPSTPWMSSQTVGQGMFLGDEGNYVTLTGGTGSSLILTVVYQVIAAQ